MMGVCYRSLNQDQQAGDIFCEELREVSQSLPLLMGGSNLPDVCWKHSTAERKRARRFLECLEETAGE